MASINCPFQMRFVITIAASGSLFLYSTNVMLLLISYSF